MLVLPVVYVRKHFLQTLTKPLRCLVDYTARLRKGFLSGYPNLPYNELHQTWQGRFGFGLQFFFKVRYCFLRVYNRADSLRFELDGV